MTFWEEVALVFTEIGWIPAICILLGLIFIIVEIFQPGFGFFGIAGAVLVAIGIAVRIYNSGGGNPIIQLIVLIGIVAVVLSVALIIMVWSMKKGWLSRTAFVQSATAVSELRSGGTPDYAFLLGKAGVAMNLLRPSGTVRIDGKDYDVVASLGAISKGSPVTVTSVEGVKITVSADDTVEAVSVVASSGATENCDIDAAQDTGATENCDIDAAQDTEPQQ